MALIGLGLGIVAIVIILIISALPLYFAVKMLGGDATIFKVIMVNVAVGIIGAVLDAPLIAFLLLLFVYKSLFNLSWFGALGAWLLQFVVAGLLIVASVVLGLGLVVL